MGGLDSSTITLTSTRLSAVNFSNLTMTSQAIDNKSAASATENTSASPTLQPMLSNSGTAPKAVASAATSPLWPVLPFAIVCICALAVESYPLEQIVVLYRLPHLFTERHIFQSLNALTFRAA